MNAFLAFVTTEAWALHKPIHATLCDIVDRHLRGEKISEAERAAWMAKASKRSIQADERAVPKGIARIPVQGVIARHSNMVNGMSQPRGTSIEALRDQLAKARKNSAGAVLDVDTPGGSVQGVTEMAAEIRDAVADGFPIVAHVDGYNASAGYWLTAGASRIAASRSSLIGSIGVYREVVDAHRAMEARGIDVDTLQGGDVKTAGHPYKRMTQAERDSLQAIVDSHYQEFVLSNSLGRGWSLEKSEELATGAAHVAPQALELGLIDSIESWQSTVEHVSELAGVSATTFVAMPSATTEDESADDAASDETPSDPIQPQEETMGEQQKGVAAIGSVADLKREHPELVASVASSAVAEAISAERARAGKILGRCTASQLELASTLIASGKDYADCVDEIIDDPRRNAQEKAEERTKAAPKPIVEGDEQTAPDSAQELTAEKVWASRSDIRDAFGGHREHFEAAFARSDRISVNGQSLASLIEKED